MNGIIDLIPYPDHRRCALNNLFGKTLRSLMDGAEVKERALAEALSYDTTYISK